jgi:hypothetical protein
MHASVHSYVACVCACVRVCEADVSFYGLWATLSEKTTSTQGFPPLGKVWVGIVVALVLPLTPAVAIRSPDTLFRSDTSVVSRACLCSDLAPFQAPSACGEIKLTHGLETTGHRTFLQTTSLCVR